MPLFLLDADLPENGRLERWITSQLYVGDPVTRLSQYVLLGVGGVRALAALGIEPALVHLNEGHAAFAALELARREVARGAPFEAALEAARQRTVFTTHTPVAAGNETYPRDGGDRHGRGSSRPSWASIPRRSCGSVATTPRTAKSRSAMTTVQLADEPRGERRQPSPRRRRP